MVTGGGSITGGLLEKIRLDVQNYLGAMNEVALGVRTDIPTKPMELRVYESMKRLGTTFTGGGFDEQPYMLVLIEEVISSELAIFEAINERSKVERKR